MTESADIAVAGLGVMGANLALNLADHGHRVAAYNRTTSVTDEFMAGEGGELGIVPAGTIEEMVRLLKRPRVVLMMVTAGKPVDAVIDSLLDHLEEGGDHVNALRVRAFPFAQSVEDFIHEHDKVFVVEQNRDGQLRTLLVNEFGIDPAKLVAVLHYDGTPITARFIVAAITERVKSMTIKIIRKKKSGTGVVNPS